MQAMPCQGSFHNAEIASQYGGTAGASHIPGMPSTAVNITDYAASLIGFGGQLPLPDGHPGAAAAGLPAMETGLGLGGSGLATNSVPLLPRVPSSAGSDAFLNPFQVSLPSLAAPGRVKSRRCGCASKSQQGALANAVSEW